MDELVTTVLDALGIVLLAAGATGAAWLLIGPGAWAVGGVVILAGSQIAARIGQRPPPSGEDAE